MQSYQDLKVWNLGMDLAVELYQISKAFPAEERFGLTSQIRKSAVSVPSNIAEGHARSSTGDYIRFLKISKASLAELETQAILSQRLGYVDRETITPFLDQIRTLGRMLNSLISKLNPDS
ncbi:MAG: four helix bundle protein [Verrucomicrobiae bacterium]|nr:four helix bundle protein [Verrucomicrobiae bacterium]